MREQHKSTNAAIVALADLVNGDELSVCEQNLVQQFGFARVENGMFRVTISGIWTLKYHNYNGLITLNSKGLSFID